MKWWYANEEERIMEFQKERCYSALNADELRAGDKVIVASTIAELKRIITGEIYCIAHIMRINDEDCENRFCIGESNATGDITYALAYLVERLENCTNCGKASCGHSGVQGLEYKSCEYWKPKTEPHYRPFKDTDELIKVWLEKGSKWQKREITEPFIWVRYKDKHIPQKGTLIRTFFEEAVSVDEKYLSLETLFKDYEFLDGSPCGVEDV